MTNNLKATKRESKTSGDLNNLRSKGFIPAILYGGNNPSLKISIEEKLLNKVFSSDSFLSTVIDLNNFEVIHNYKHDITKMINQVTNTREFSRIKIGD